MFFRKVSLVLALCMMVTLLAGCGNTASDNGDGASELAEVIGDTGETEEVDGDIVFDVPYLDDGNERHVLDLFGTQEATDKTPGVIEVHGGGYIGGSKSINTEHAAFYRDNGFVVAAPEYTLVKEGKTFKDAIQDLFAAYHFIEEHADEYHFDLDNMFLSGDSAGGYYVLLTAAILQSEELQAYFEVEPLGFEFKGIVTTCPGTDILAIKDNLGADGVNGFVANSIGEEILNDEDLMSHLDLYSIIDPATYPYIYIVTTPDDETTGEETLKFDAFLTENGIAHELHGYESEGSPMKHVFNIISMDWPESIKANNDIVAYMKSLL